MIETRLILIEGLPCSGKTTLSRYLQKEYIANSKPAKSHDESYEGHPVVIDYDGLYSATEGKRYLAQWGDFVEQKRDSDVKDLIDNRFWINIGAFIIYSGLPTHDLFELNRRTIEILEPLNPILIHFRHTSTDDGILRACRFRGEMWVDWLLKRDLAFPWFQERGITDFEGYLEFWRYWQSVTDALWTQCPFQKVELVDAHEDWEGSYRRVFEFLGVQPRDSS